MIFSGRLLHVDINLLVILLKNVCCQLLRRLLCQSGKLDWEKTYIRPGRKRVVCQPLFTLANTLVHLMRSAVNSLNWLNINLWMSKWKFWLLRLPKGNVSLVHLKQNQRSLLLPLICWKSRTFRWLHLGCIHELQMLHNIEDSLSLSIVFSHIPCK